MVVSIRVSLHTFLSGICPPPKYFNIDKRYGHLSDLINLNQKTRKEAIAELKEPSYPLELQQKDLDFVASKFGFEKKSF